MADERLPEAIQAGKIDCHHRWYLLPVTTSDNKTFARKPIILLGDQRATSIAL